MQGRDAPAAHTVAEIPTVIKGRSGKRPAYLVDPDSGCWNCTGALNGGNYRMLHSRPAHRVAYERTHGRIPSGMQIHHICLNPACMNPAHCVALTRADHAKIHAFLMQERRRAA